jgi:AAA+ superfamily predicted ATPase
MDKKEGYMVGIWEKEREALDGLVIVHKDWMEKFLGTPESDWVFHKRTEETEGLLLPFALFKKVSGRTGYLHDKLEEVVSEDISDVVFAPKSKWTYSLKKNQEGRRTKSVLLQPGDLSSVVGFSIPKIGIKVVLLKSDYLIAPLSYATIPLSHLVTSFSDSLKLREYLAGVLNSVEEKEYSIYTYDNDNKGDLTVTRSKGIPQEWKNLVLEDSVLHLVKRDTESFFSRKDWFLKNEIPFRRGYLLHGPPGNGKTSVIKTMLSTLGMNAYKIRLFSQNVNDNVLETMFRVAQETGPNMVILEDLDRAFPKTGEKKSPIGLHTLLNCLDGLESQEGVITIATANEPTALDKVILKRPGRFDRVILFDNPSHELRLDFFLKKAPYLKKEDLEPAVDASEGFSFAQLQETYILAGQYAFERKEEKVLASDLHVCSAELRGATNSVDIREGRLGYQKYSR